MTSFAVEKSAASARVITAFAEVPSTLTGTPSTLAKVPSTGAEVISFWRKVDREWRKMGRGCGKVARDCGEVGGGGGKWMGAPLTTGIYDARMVGVRRSLAALSVVDGGERGRNRCFLA